MAVGNAVEKKDTPLNPEYLAILEKFVGARGRRIIGLLAAGQVLAPAVRWLFDKFLRREDFKISVAGMDDIYSELHEWVLERIPEEHRRAMIASTHSFIEEGDKARSEVKLRYDGSRRQTMHLDGHKVVVEVEREEVPGRANLPENWRELTEKITFTTSSTVGRDAVVRVIEGLLAKKRGEEKPPPLFMPSNWGSGWVRRRDLPPRTIDSVVLKSGQRDHLVDDLTRFLGAEGDYERLCQPWHRGYLFYGDPGTGKTSAARALANHFDMPTYYLPLGDMSKDADLLNLLATVDPRSVLLIEDVDVFQSMTERAQDDSHVSMSAVLNALDGVWTPHGLVTIMTTNDRDKLDPALLRAGRLDVQERFTHLDQEQVTAFLDSFDAHGDLNGERFVGAPPAELVEHLRAHVVHGGGLHG